MDEKCYIRMEHVNMSYPSSVYNASTIKQEVFAWIKHEKKRRIIRGIQALKDFNLYAQEGDRIGVIGHNGAGKSTLLKTIAGIYPIESGEIEVHGKIRALFDISLGFDLESTGRENILYRGLLLGATPDEIRGKTEEIIAFADIGEFIDYPVKSYSTGMAVRLAFAVSTCIAGDILLLDEVVGAGDASFMKKARDRIYSLMDQSSVMVFVSHDLSTIQEVCNRVILLDHGVIVGDGKPDEIVRQYLKSISG